MIHTIGRKGCACGHNALAHYRCTEAGRECLVHCVGKGCDRFDCPRPPITGGYTQQVLP